MDLELLKSIRNNPRKMRQTYLASIGLLDDIMAVPVSENWKIKERIDWLLESNHIVCKVCDNYSKPNSKWCSLSCRNKDPDIRSSQGKSISDKKDIAAEKRKKTNLKKYGVEHILQNSIVVDNLKSNRKQKDYDTTKNTISSKFTFDIESHNHWEKLLSSQESSLVNFSKKHGVNFMTLTRWFEKIGFDHSKYFPKQSSGGERELAGWLESIGIRVERNVTKLLSSRLEIDIYLPDYMVGIEYNGLYWHKNDEYGMLNKQKLATEKNIMLLHVYEDEWENKQDIVKSIILSKINIFEKRYFAKDTKKIKISKAIAMEFLNENHIDGFSISAEYLGLVDKENKLVAVVSIGKSRFSKNERELVRYASLKNTQIVGGISKLLKGEGEMISYANKRYSPIKANYGQFGNLIGKTPPGYFWYKNPKEGRISRFKTQKHKLGTFLGHEIDNTKTENYIMEDHGYYKVYDCGNWKYHIHLI